MQYSIQRLIFAPFHACWRLAKRLLWQSKKRWHNKLLVPTANQKYHSLLWQQNIGMEIAWTTFTWKTAHKKKKIFSCSLCDASFNQTNQLGEHYKTAHKDKDQTNFHCSVCLRLFKTQENLKRHFDRMHTSSQKKNSLSCFFCTEKFEKSSNLTEHIAAIHCKKVVKKETKATGNVHLHNYFNIHDCLKTVEATAQTTA